MNAELSGQTRRAFLRNIGAAAVGVSVVSGAAFAVEAGTSRNRSQVPWYRRTYRWGQTNITEADPARYDINWWREYWKRTRVQGVIINAGGIFAYYPSKFSLHFRPRALGDRDLYGELAAAAHSDGLSVFARMDSNRAHEGVFNAHPEWFARQKNGEPYRAGEHYITCIHGPYYEEYLPAILREIIERSRPEGITDNSWAGLGRNSICYCQNCRSSFRKHGALPEEKNWDDPLYRKWIEWSYSRRIEIWELNNRVTKEAGGPDCIWSGMNSGSISGQSASFRDYREICRRAEIIMLDHQSRSESSGFQHNAEIGKLIHGLLGWEKLVPESMAMYQAGRPTFRLSSKPPLEARLWMAEGFAGGIQPWWHHVSAYHEDGRMYRTAESLMRWHEANEEYLVNRKPIANVGLVWSQRNTDFFGRDQADELVELPLRGFTNALVKARIPYLPVHIDDISTHQFDVLIFANIGALSDPQLEAVRSFVRRGGNLVVTGQTSRFTEYGDRRQDFGLADLLGVHVTEPAAASARRISSSEASHSYMRLVPELRGSSYGPRDGTEPRINAKRHPILNGFEETDILPFGGSLSPLGLDTDVSVHATFIPPFPVYPPETAWMRRPRTDIPGIMTRTLPNGSRIVYFSAEIDKRFARDNLPDQQRLLENAVRWAAKDAFPLSVEGPGFIDCHLYRQDERLILHLVNLTSTGAWRAPVDEIQSIGPLQIIISNSVRGLNRASKVRFLVSGESARLRRRNRLLAFTCPKLHLHEVAVIG